MAVIPKGAPADEVAVDDAGFVDKNAAAHFEVKLRLRHRGHPAALHAIGAGDDFHAVAHTGDGRVLLEKVTRDAQQILVLANVFRRAATAEKDTEVLLRPHIFERDRRGHGVAFPLLGDRPARFVLVHHQLVLALFRRREHRFVTALDQTEVGIHRVDRLGGIPENNQHPGSGLVTHGCHELTPGQSLFQAN